MQVYAGSLKSIPVLLYASYTLFFLLTIFVIKYIYISNTSKKSETSETGRINAVFRGETEVKQSETSETGSNNQHFNKFFFIYEVNSNFFINVCRLYAGCMQVVCRFTKPIPVRLYASYTLFFPINYFVIKKLYIKNICKKSVTSVTTNTSACYRGVTEV